MVRLEISRDIAAPPELVYAAISDVTRMGEWSEECRQCRWHDGYDGPVVGATFDGHNRHGDHEWTTQAKVIEASPGRAFAFECSMMEFHYSTWGYRIEPTASGSRVTGVERGPSARLCHRVQPSGLRCRRPDGAKPADHERHPGAPGCRFGGLSRYADPVMRANRSRASATRSGCVNTKSRSCRTAATT